MWLVVGRPGTLTDNTLAETRFSGVMLVDTERGHSSSRASSHTSVKLEWTRTRKSQKEDEMARPKTLVDKELKIGLSWMRGEQEPWEDGGRFGGRDGERSGPSDRSEEATPAHCQG